MISHTPAPAAARPARTMLASLAGRDDVSTSLAAAGVLFVAALTAAASQVSIVLPFTPVPFTLQPLIVLLGGAALGARLGALSQGLYLAVGVMGLLPVFAASPLLPQGFARLLGPTGGYLLAFPAAAFVTGWLAERGFGRRYATSLVAMTAGLATIFAGGVAWLAWLSPAPAGVATALQIGFYPFVMADLLKVAVAAAVLPAAWRFLGRRPFRFDTSP